MPHGMIEPTRDASVHLPSVRTARLSAKKVGKQQVNNYADGSPVTSLASRGSSEHG